MHGDFACLVAGCLLRLLFLSRCIKTLRTASKSNSKANGGRNTGTFDEGTWLGHAIPSMCQQIPATLAGACCGADLLTR
ncbi:hypothetical protein F5J12DRAFT_845586 [Pisolithus orientalis]|uniref:uncharacterized protein n=1 Tax=Pisolithus orientalis TaxID=936130 RepID=UPI0022259CD7|nr:uncharacterized protein F5J12DRAFT_845586 [Pisolithus orientalis]KAI6000364.1 hypothetical protein F5J12DRAFT_845586 [Pisolithus orientalis]